MTPELRKQITDRYTGWAETWGLSFAFAVTQSVEKAERIVADAIVALITADAEEEAARVLEARLRFFRRDTLSEHTDDAQVALPVAPLTRVTAVRFATSLWELANAQAYRGFGADAFFRMPAVARAIAVLKTKARFSRAQIAIVLELKISQVDDHLENARLLFSDGRPWIEASPGLLVAEDRWAPECPQWNATAPRADGEGLDIQHTFAHYVGNDLGPEEGSQLHSHLLVCTTCRTSFAHFKRQYTDWASSIPTIEPAPEMRKHLDKITKLALKANRRLAKPSPWPGIRRMARDWQTRAMVYGAGLFILGQLFLHKHPSAKLALRRGIHKILHHL